MAIEIKRRPYEWSWSGNPVQYRLYSDQAAVDDSIFFEVKIMFKKIADGAYTEIVTLPYSPAAGTADVDIKDVLDSLLEHELPLLQVDETAATEATTQTGNFYIQFRQITEANPDPSWEDSEKDFYRSVIKGGIDYFKWRGNNFWLNYFTAPEIPFLTWQKSGRLAAIDERMYLAWLYKIGYVAGGLKVFAVAYFTDGTTTSVSATFGGTSGNVFYIPAGASQWGLDLIYPDKKIYYWTINVVDITDPENAVPVSQIFKYYADNRNDYNDVGLNYRNSLGGLDSNKVRGVIDDTLNYEFTEQDHTYEPNYFEGNNITAKRIISNSKERKIWKGDIGYLAKEDQDRFRDSHLKRELWWERSKKWWPVILLTGNQKQKSSEDHLWSFPIEFTLASDGDNYYTPDAVDLGDGVFTSNVCLALVLGITYVNDLSGPDAIVTIYISFSDPDLVATQYYYQVDNDTPVLMNLADLPLVITLAKDDTYSFKAWVMCPNDVPGRKSSVMIDTNDGVGGGGGGGGGGGTPDNSFISNYTSNETDYDFKINSISQHTGHLGSFGVENFGQADQSDVQVKLILDSLTPSIAELVSNGNTYYAAIATAVVTWSHVDITNGFQINLY